MKIRILLVSSVLLLGSVIACGIGPSVSLTAPSPDQLSAAPDGTEAISPTLPEVALPSAGCDDRQPSFVTSHDVLQTPDLSEPAPHVPFPDPVFGTCVVRVTDRTADLAGDDSSGGIKNEYSRIQSFNADGSLILLRGTAATWYVYNAASLEPLSQLPIVEEPRWDAAQPHILYYIDGVQLIQLNVLNGSQNITHDFAADLPNMPINAVWTRWEGSPSFDTRYWGLMMENQDWLTAAFLIYDLQSDQVVAIRETPDLPEIDSVTISPLGNYFLVYHDAYCEHGQLGTEAAPCGLMVYDRSLQNGRGLLRLIGHSDTAVDENGREVMIFQNIDTDNISLLDLETGAVTDLVPIDFSHTAVGFHFSGRASEKPGWALVSTYNGGYPTDYTWMDDVVFAMELKSGGRIVRLAHTHSLVDESQEHDYWAEPQASVNRDFTRILFTTNWYRSGTEEVETMLITLPDDWIEDLP